MLSALVSPVTGDGGVPSPTVTELSTDANASRVGNVTFAPVTDSPLNPVISLSPCLWIFAKFIGDTYVVPWDIFLLVPNAMFCLLLLASAKKSVTRLRALSSPIVTTFYVLVCLTCLFGTVRCVVIMFFSSFNALHNQILWLIVRFFQLVTELSVLILGLIFGHGDSRTGIRRVLLTTISIALLYAVGQGVSEKMYHRVYFDQDIYLHGGIMFTMISSAVFSVIYCCITALPFLPMERLNVLVPRKRSFYLYTLCLCVINVIGCVGAALVNNYGNQRGFCLVSISLFVYFSLFPPLIYIVFLFPFLRTPSEEPSRTPSTETAHLLDCNYSVNQQLHYSSSAITASRTRDTSSQEVKSTFSQGSLTDHGQYGSFTLGYEPATPPSIYSDVPHGVNYPNGYDSSSSSDSDTPPTDPESECAGGGDVMT